MHHHKYILMQCFIIKISQLSKHKHRLEDYVYKKSLNLHFIILFYLKI